MLFLYCNIVKANVFAAWTAARFVFGKGKLDANAREKARIV